MNRVVLQIPLQLGLRKEAEQEALRQGFSSLQDAVRFFLRKLANREIAVGFEEPEVTQLSPRAIKRYNKISDDIENGRNIYHAKDVDDLMRQLHEG